MSKERFDPTVLALLAGRTVRNIDLSIVNVLRIDFIDGSYVEFEVDAIGPGLYGNVMSGFKLDNTVDARLVQGDLRFSDLRLCNVVRCEAADGFKFPIHEWNILEWAGAMAGEAGEAANVAKKLRRGDYGPSPKTVKYEEGRAALAKELGDTVIYADLAAAREGINLADAVREAFNSKSNEIGCRIKL